MECKQSEFMRVCVWCNEWASVEKLCVLGKEENKANTHHIPGSKFKLTISFASNLWPKMRKKENIFYLTSILNN